LRRGELFYLYYITRWIILFIITLLLTTLFILENPSVILRLIATPLKEQGISYKSIEGSILSGFNLKGFKYQDKIEAKNIGLKVNWDRLKSRVLYIDNIKLDGIHINKDYLKSLIDSNSSDDNSSLPFNKIIINSANISLKNIIYGDYSIKYANLKLKKFTTNIKDKYKGQIELKVDSNVTKLNIKGHINNNFVKLNGEVNPNIKFIKPFLPKNIKIKKEPRFTIKASGNLKKVKYYLITNSLNVDIDKYNINNKRLILWGDYNIEKKDIDLSVDTILNSNIANLKLKGNTKLNLDDINRTLRFNIKANIRPKKEFVESKIPDNSITFEKVATINVDLNGELKRVDFKVDFRDLRVKREDINLKLSSVLLHGHSNILKGDTAVDIKTYFNSTVGDGDITDKATINFNNIKTLKYRAKIDIKLKPRYINRFLEDKNITIIGSPKANINLSGGVEKLSLKVNLYTKFLKDKKISHLKLNSSLIKLDFKRHNIKGIVDIKNSSKNIEFTVNSKFDGDYINIKELKTDTKISVKKFNDFGVNLNPLMPINLKIRNSKNGAFIKLYSDRIKFNAKTKDYDKFTFNINTGNLYIYKIIKLPEELHHKFIKLDLKGDALLSKKYFNIKGYIYSNKKFKTKIDAENSKFGLHAKIDTERLKVKVTGNIDKRDIKAELKIESIKKLQKEMNKLYPFKIAKVDGSLDANLRVKGKKVWFKISSPKIELNGFNIEHIDIDANYNKNLITLNKINLKTTGFKDKKLNKNIHLNRKGKIYLGEKRDILIDMLPNLLIVAKGDKYRLNARAIIRKFPIGHPDYGTMFLNSNIKYNQIGDKKRITGNLNIKKMKLFYEAKFLDADYDPDVIIVTKKSKKIKKELAGNSFLNDTYIDIKVKAPQANYKTPDIDLNFDVNLNINKAFGKPIALLGRIEDINGRFDQVPKRFKIQNSTIVFDGGKDINPLLDIKVEYELPQVLIKISIGGYANRPKIDFTSEPPMPKKDIMSYLLLGVSTANLTNGEGSLGREAELFILNQAARDFAYDFNLDRLFIKDDGTGEGYIVEVGKKITKRDMVIIESSPTGNSYILEHDFSKNIKLRVGQHQKEHPSQSIDLFFRKRFK